MMISLEAAMSVEERSMLDVPAMDVKQVQPPKAQELKSLHIILHRSLNPTAARQRVRGNVPSPVSPAPVERLIVWRFMDYHSGFFAMVGGVVFLEGIYTKTDKAMLPEIIHETAKPAGCSKRISGQA
jgi:hypothetical protein